ncbi:hypothetical protein LJC08_05740 [Methanimicrococcus sp. OttesenSCG-928-J09]|nr:hypothetical protein [Methanimicrococcus sp. OttesenSCG-928-J09]
MPAIATLPILFAMCTYRFRFSLLPYQFRLPYVPADSVRTAAAARELHKFLKIEEKGIMFLKSEKTETNIIIEY